MCFCLAVLLLCVSNALCKVTDAMAKEEPVDYCSIASCEDPADHVMCLYKDVEGEACVNFQKDKGFSAAEKRGILKAHNELRSAVAIGAMGQFVPYGHNMAGAMDMQEMHWDDELEMLAQRWAKQCMVNVQDKCRNTARYSTVGQLIFKKNWDPSSSLSFHVNLAFLQAGSSNVMYPPFKFAAQYTATIKQRVLAQLVWASADRVGCARTVFDRDSSKEPVRSVLKDSKGPMGRQDEEVENPTEAPEEPVDDPQDPIETPEDSTETPEDTTETSKNTVLTTQGPTELPQDPDVSPREIMELVVCNYNDGGQMNGKIYTPGQSCSLCFCSAVYPGLCGSADAIEALMVHWIPATLLVLRFYKIH